MCVIDLSGNLHTQKQLYGLLRDMVKIYVKRQTRTLPNTFLNYNYWHRFVVMWNKNVVPCYKEDS